MPFGFGGSKEKNEKLPSNTHLRDSDHLEEISKDGKDQMKIVNRIA
jgi:hypothetical protein